MNCLVLLVSDCEVINFAFVMIKDMVPMEISRGCHVNHVCLQVLLLLALPERQHHNIT
jgi:hypothetical protein